MPETTSANPDDDRHSPELSRHGYWGPLPGESPELYKALYARRWERTILARVPQNWRGEFNMEAGRDLKVRPRSKPPTPPEELTRQERLEKFIGFTKGNEVVHMAGIALFGAIGLGGAIEGGWFGAGLAIAMGATNTVVNIPPIIVQRHNRLRAYRLLDKIDGSDAT